MCRVIKTTPGFSCDISQRIGAAEARWAHNPKVRRSKLRFAMVSRLLRDGVVGNISACHADARGSIPRRGAHLSHSFFFVVVHKHLTTFSSYCSCLCFHSSRFMALCTSTSLESCSVSSSETKVASMAQLAEHAAVNRRVPGSSPGGSGNF